MLREQDHDAVHIEAAIGAGTADPVVVEHARETDRLVLATDTDVLRPGHRQGVSVLYCPATAMRAHDVAALVGELEAVVPDQTALPAVPWLTDDALS